MGDRELLVPGENPVKIVPPVDVRAVMADGSEVPLECVYVGWDGETHRWDAVVRLGEVPASLRIGMLPALTSVGVRMAP
jgi:hypothetical protein